MSGFARGALRTMLSRILPEGPDYWVRIEDDAGAIVGEARPVTVSTGTRSVDLRTATALHWKVPGDRPWRLVLGCGADVIGWGDWMRADEMHIEPGPAVTIAF